MTEMNIVVIGCGSIGTRHLKNVLQLLAAGFFAQTNVVVAIVDSDAKKRKAAEAAHGVRGYDSLAQAVRPDRENVVFVCTPSSSHIAIAREAAQRDCHLFIEKPLAISLQGIAELKTILQKTGRICLVACNMWFHPAVRKIKEILAAGELGAPCLFRSYWGHHVRQWHPGTVDRNHYTFNENEGGGVLFDVGAHDLFFVPKLLGNIASGSMEQGASGSIDAPINDYAHISVQCENGIAGVFTFNYLDRCRRRMVEIVGEKATLCWSSLGKNPMREQLSIYPGNGAWREIPVEPAVDIMFIDMLKHFFGCIAGKEQPVQTLEDGERVLRLLLALKTDGAL